MSVLLVLALQGSLTHAYGHLLGNDHDDEILDARGKVVGEKVCEVCLAFDQLGPALLQHLTVLPVLPFWQQIAISLPHFRHGETALHYRSRAPPFPLI
ncbi:hypothetical protein [Andreprevotia chitinilytica]|uniref:hypothetical protein n=1 Tax=Andreprevotia chitinilytica TaxID=396808 RepID=UPI00146FF24C|nr:hypothetical protein [Andreprevotia chitinilytica]